MASKGLSDADFEPPKMSDADFHGPDEAPAIVQEMPDEVSALHRFVAKNFANSPESQVGYLKTKYPNMEIKAQDGNVLMRNPGEPSYKVLDPNQPWMQRLSHPMSALKEGAMDLGDIPYDIGSGIASTAAGAGAALAAAPETLGIGSIPAAMLASGGTGAGLEALRQGIGKALGIPQDFSKKDIAISGAANAAAPLLFGTGASAANIAAKSAEDALTPAETEALKNAQKGLFGRFYAKGASLLSGIPKDTIEAAGENLDKLKTLESSRTPNQNLAQSVLDDINQLKSAKTAEGRAREALISGSEKSVPLAPAKAPYLNAISKFEALENKAIEAGDEGAYNLASQNKQAAQDEFDRIFKGFGDSTSAEGAQALKDPIKEAANISKAGSKGVGVPDQLSATSQLRQNLARQAGRAHSQAMKDSLPELADHDAQYSWMSNLLKQLGPSSKSEDRALSLIKSINSGGRKALSESMGTADQNLGTQFKNKSALIDAFNTFGKNRAINTGLKAIGQRAVSRIPAEGLGLYMGYKEGGIPGSLAGAGTGYLLGSPAAIRLGLQGGQTLRPLAPGLWNMIQTEKEQNQ